MRRLNPTARIIRTDHGVVHAGEPSSTPVCSIPWLAEAEAPGWDEEIADGHTPETEEYGISSMTFRADRPFHPERLARALENVTGLLRSKGFCWIASRPLIAAIWSQAGPEPGDRAGAAVVHGGVPPGQEIVFIGVRLDRALVHDQFESALLTDAEVAAGQREWLTYHDPLPAWGVTHTH